MNLSRFELAGESMDAFFRAWDHQPLFMQGAGAQGAAAGRDGLDPLMLARSFDVLGLGVMPSAWEKLAYIEAPVHLVAGAHDSKFAALSRRAAQHLPNSTVTLVPGAHHRVALEAPTSLAQAMRAAGR